MTQPQPSQWTAGSSGSGADGDTATVSALQADVARAHSDYGAGSLILCDRLVRIYTAEGIEVQALQGLDLLVGTGELTALVGASGSGKSTLMNILAGLDSPTAGGVRVAGHDLASMTARQRLAYRRSVVGFIWQQTARNLLPYLTATQNVELPLRLAGTGRPTRRKRAAELLELLSVAHCAGRRPDQMSGGEQQRVSIAVALSNSPSVLLADEPTGELDSATAASVFGALQTANSELGVTVLVVTHDPAVSSMVRRTIAIRDGRTATETLRHDCRRLRRVRARGGVRGPRPGRPAPASPGDDRRPRHARPRPPGGGTRSHRRVAGPAQRRRGPVRVRARFPERVRHFRI